MGGDKKAKKPGTLTAFVLFITGIVLITIEISRDGKYFDNYFSNRFLLWSGMMCIAIALFSNFKKKRKNKSK